MICNARDITVFINYIANIFQFVDLLVHFLFEIFFVALNAYKFIELCGKMLKMLKIFNINDFNFKFPTNHEVLEL